MDKLIIQVEQSLQFHQQLLKFHTCLKQKFSELEFPNCHRDLIEFLTKSLNTHVVAFLPCEELQLLLKYLLQFQDGSEVKNEVNKKMQQWSYIQLQYIAKIPEYIMKKFPFIAEYTLSNILEKIISRIQTDFSLLSQGNTQVDILEKIACQLGYIYLSSISAKEKQIAKCLLILSEIRKIRPFKTDTEEFLDEIFQKLKTENLDLQSRTHELLLICYSTALEFETLNLIFICSDIEKYLDTSHIEPLLHSSKVVSVCKQNPLSFQKALSIMSGIWFNSNGHPHITQILSSFVSIINTQCLDQTIIPLFPCNLQHLVMLLIIPPVYYSCPRMKFNLWQRCLDALKDEVCDRKEIIVMFVIYSEWYIHLLRDANDMVNKNAMELIKILWSSDNEEAILKEIKVILSI